MGLDWYNADVYKHAAIPLTVILDNVYSEFTEKSKSIKCLLGGYTDSSEWNSIIGKI